LKSWSCEIEIHFTQSGIEAETKDELKEKVVDLFKEEYNLELQDHEIKKIVRFN